MTEEEALVRSICEVPGDDTRRLAYADWLDEHPEVLCPSCRGSGLRPKKYAQEENDYTCGRCGERSNVYGHWTGSGWSCEPPECKQCNGARTITPADRRDRAEFIRVQCELWRWPKESNWLEQMPVEQWKGPDEDGEVLRRLAPLVKRHTELCGLYVRDCKGWSREFISGVFGKDWLPWSATWDWGWSRGFVSGVSLLTSEFLEYAERLFRLQPITSVGLADKVPWIPTFQDESTATKIWCWWDETEFRIHQNGSHDPGNIPTPLFEIMWERNPSNRRDNSEAGRWLKWEDPDAPESELSAACVALGRKKAELPQL